MWLRLNKLIKPNGAIVLFGSEPFSSALRMSNIKNYKYDWKWLKNTCTGTSQSRYMPMKNYEDVLIFYKSKPTFNKQKTITKSQHIYNCAEKGLTRKINTKTEHNSMGGYCGGDFKKEVNPRMIIENINTVNNRSKSRVHQTQKPVTLMEYLVKTYTNEDDTVLDFTMGSGTTAVACENTNRGWICIEQEEKYCEIHKNRL